MVEFASLPNGVLIGTGELLSYLIFHSPGSGWWLDVYVNAYCEGELSWPHIRQSQPSDCALVRSADLASALAQAYDSLSCVHALRMDRARELSGCAT